MGFAPMASPILMMPEMDMCIGALRGREVTKAHFDEHNIEDVYAHFAAWERMNTWSVPLLMNLAGLSVHVVVRKGDDDAIALKRDENSCHHWRGNCCPISWHTVFTCSVASTSPQAHCCGRCCYCCCGCFARTFRLTGHDSFPRTSHGVII